jgi:hypothetical protein
MASDFEPELLERLRRLDPERQHEVLDFVEFLSYQRTPRSARRSAMRKYQHLGISIPKEEFDLARREALGNDAGEEH